jgi:hypothetical protein
VAPNRWCGGPGLSARAGRFCRAGRGCWFPPTNFALRRTKRLLRRTKLLLPRTRSFVRRTKKFVDASISHVRGSQCLSAPTWKSATRSQILPRRSEQDVRVGRFSVSSTERFTTAEQASGATHQFRASLKQTPGPRKQSFASEDEGARPRDQRFGTRKPGFGPGNQPFAPRNQRSCPRDEGFGLPGQALAHGNQHVTAVPRRAGGRRLSVEHTSPAEPAARASRPHPSPARRRRRLHASRRDAGAPRRFAAKPRPVPRHFRRIFSIAFPFASSSISLSR